MWSRLALLLLAAAAAALPELEDGVTRPRGARIRCYDDAGRPQRCIPPFENAAFQLQVEATNTCGELQPSEYCVQTGSSGKSCDICVKGSHPPSFLTDFNNNDNQTWWQSETMYEDIQYPNQVNLTLRLGKAFDITYIRLWFYSPRPESFAIYKRTTHNSPWVPYQFYSATCRDTYGLPETAYTRKGDEARALCTSEYSDISPLSGGIVAFSTLEGRPSAYQFDSTPELQDWVTATELRITLDKLNTFGDEVFGDDHVLRSYFFAISDFAVGARCKCNGHASECISVSDLSGQPVRVCRCEHNTAGPDCNECLPFYNDAPWGRASATDAHECRACNCNGFSNRCFFDKDLYEKTGHGGHCLDCTGNRDGPNCERCKENFYQREDGYCIACNCNEIGSRSLQCNREGRCQCKPGVTGDKCDHCDVNYYDFTSLGCRSCGCSTAGSYGNVANCNPYTGSCQCKENVEGKRCSGCKPGYFNLDVENEFGCTPCFCYGHSSQCESAPGYSKVIIESMFARNNERWSAQEYSGNPVKLQYHSITQSIGINAPGRDPVYFVAPDRFLGDQRASYNQILSFKLRIGENGPGATVEDVVIEGAGLTITQAIFGQHNPLPSVETQEFKFRLHEHPQYGWQPRLSSRDFISVLANLTAIHIRGTYTPEGVGFLDDVTLETAHRGAAGLPARWIENCKCLSGYVGQFCESCEPGFRHEPANGGPFAPCVPCNCNGHADICDAETGRCICQHNTAGDNCDRCARGYYGNALQGTAYDCKPCPCPKQGPCIQLQDETIICLECPKGYGGPRCDLCSDGYFGDPTGRFGSVKLCQPCKCNDNVDPNAVGNCNRTTGECLKCIYNTGGPECDTCIPGYYGDALALPKGDCKPCQCYPPGTVETDFGPPVCDQISGQCQCKPHIYGRNCDNCEEGYYNIVSGEGCQACNCDPVGSLNHTCDLQTGQCHCRPGITGLRCDVCELYHYGFSIDGCKECDCDPIGSVNLTCNPWGQCPCYENVEGRRCDRCKENKYDRQRGCIDCPACYNLVQDAADIHREKLSKLKRVLDDIASNPTVISDENFERRLKEVEDAVGHLWTRAKQAVGGGGRSLSERLDDLIMRLEAVGNITKQIDSGTKKAESATRKGEEHVTEAETIIESALQALKDTMDLLQTEGYISLQKAKEQSDQFGQQSNQMSENAREARIFASSHEQEANAIKEIAEKAVNTSTQAYELAKEAVSQQQNLSEEIRKLRNDIDSSENQLELTRALTNDAKQRAEKSHKDALNIYTEISALHIPQTDISKLKASAEDISMRAKEIMDEAELLLESQTETLDDLEDQLIKAEDLLAHAIEQQQQADDLLADVHAASVEAEEALKLANKTLTDAQETYNTLQAFDKQVQDSKDLANQALMKVPEIKRQITEAENKTDRAEQALSGALQNAEYARDTAQEAQKKFAEQASQEADLIRKKANDTKSEAVRLRDEAEALSGRVAVTGNNVKLFEDKASKVRNLTDEAKTKVGQAKSNAAKATDQIEAALADVQAIIDELLELPDIDGAALDDLERRLSEAENELKNANIEERIETLKYYRLEQNQGIKTHEEELERLKLEVDNIDAIQAALPEGCWKRLALEP